MTRLLLLQTAAPERVRARAEEILSGRDYADPEITLLCDDDPDTIRYFREVASLRVLPLRTRGRRRLLQDLNREGFHVLVAFWTGEKRYRRRKLLPLRMKARTRHIEIGDGSVFELSGKAILRHALFRWKHPLPVDHWDFISTAADTPVRSEKILIIQSAEPAYVLRGLEVLKERKLFQNPRYSLFCRNKPEITKHFLDHPMFENVLIHSEARNSWKHLTSIRRQRFDGLVLFFTGDPSYWKVKCFAFLLGARYKVIFNENNDCFYLAPGPAMALLLQRLGERSRMGGSTRWTHQAKLLLLLFMKALILPFRVIWLLLIWLRLRKRGVRV
jgi:hypothetical protein